MFKLDIDKIKTIDDIKALIRAIVPGGIQFDENYSKIDEVKHLFEGSKEVYQFSEVSRLEVIGPDGREYVRYFEDEEWMHYSLQDDDRTLKIFIEDSK